MIAEAVIDEPICAICREDTECDFITRCGHHFHESCLSKTFIGTTSKSCPYCRAAISGSKLAEKVLYNTKNMDNNARNDIQTILTNISGGFDYEYNRFNSRKIEIVPFGKFALKELVKAGWDVNSPKDGGHKLVEWICERDDLYRLNLLFEFGLSFDDNPDLKKKALETARYKNSNLVASRINDCDLNVCTDEKGNSPLHTAVIKGNLETIKDLISKGADVNARNIHGVRPLHLAAVEANLEIVGCLIENGAIVDCLDLNGRNPVYEACRSSKTGTATVISKFLDIGAKTDILDTDKNTLMHVVLISKQFGIAERLLGSYSDINQLNVYGETCLHLAASHGPKALLEKMIEAGADVNVKDLMGQTPFHKAVMTNKVEVVEYLLQKGADVNALTNKKEYPILLALKRIPSLPFVKVLVRHGADLSIKDQNGLSTLELALESRY